MSDREAPARRLRWLGLLPLAAILAVLAPATEAADPQPVDAPGPLLDADAAVVPDGVTVAPQLDTPEEAVTSYERLRIEVDVQRIKYAAEHVDALPWLVARLHLLDPDFTPAENEYVVAAYKQDDSLLRRLTAAAQFASLLSGSTFTIVPHRKLGQTEALVLVRRLNRVLQQDEDGTYGVYDERQNVDIRLRRVGEAWRVVDEQPPEVVLPPRMSPVDTPTLHLPRSAVDSPMKLTPAPGAQPHQHAELAEDVAQAYLQYTREYVRAIAPSAAELRFEKQASEYQMQWLAPLTDEDAVSAPGGGATVSWQARMEQADLIAWLEARIEHREALTRFEYPSAPIGDDAYEGRFDEFRISKVARYDDAFTPDDRHKTDNKTMALFHLDEGRDGPAVDATPARFRADWVVGADDRGRAIRARNVIWTREPRTGRVALTFYPARRSGVTLENSVGLRPIDEFTVEAWIYPFSPGEGRAQTLVAQWSDWAINPTGRKSGYRLQIAADGTLQFDIGNGERTLQTQTTAKVERQRWQHVAAQFKMRDRFAIYLDGEPVAEAKLAHPLQPEDSEDAIDAADPFDRIAASPRSIHWGCTALPPWPPELAEAGFYRYRLPIDAHYLDIDFDDDGSGEAGTDDAPKYALYRLRDVDDGEYSAAAFSLALTRSGMRIQAVRLPTIGE